MAIREPRGAAAREARTVAPGSVSALLAELARAPEEPSQETGLVRGLAIGRFELVRELGRGGFGVVWEARDRELDRSVALKLLRPGKRADLQDERLRREAEAAARLSHDNIAAIYDVGTSDCGAYLVLELLRGKTLAQRLEEGPIALQDAVRIAADVAKGVAHAHARGVIHRDLKPANVFLCDDGRVKVLDFGLAHAFGHRRQPGGTPAYMAPEQWRDAPEDERTDVFALGAILYRMLANALPFAGESEVVGTRRAPALEIPNAPGLGALVARTLEKDPVKRPRDAGEVLREIELHLQELRSAKRRNPPTVKTLRHPRWRVGVLVGVGAAAALAASTGYRLWPRPELPQVVVAVADFENNTGEKDLDGLSGMLITTLEQSRRFSVLTRTRVIDLARQAGADVQHIDEALGREICLRGKANALIVAAVHKFGEIYAIDVKIVDPQKQAYLMSFQERGKGRESIPGLIDKISERARTGFSEKPAEVDASRVRVSEAYTPNLEAYHHYVLGEGLFYGSPTDYVQVSHAREQFRRAASLDPGFAMAHYREALTLVVDERDARAPIAAAVARIRSLGSKERAYVLALQARIEKRTAEAIARYEELLRTYPEEKEARLLLAQLRCSVPQTDPSEFRRGAMEARAAIVLDPGNTLGVLLPVGEARSPGLQQLSAWEQLIQCEFFGGNPPGWLDAARQYARDVPSPRSMAHLGLAELGVGHADEAVRAFEQANRTYPEDAEGILGLAAVRLKQDDFRGAEQEYRRLLSGSVERQREGWYGLSWTSAFRGRYREAVERLDEIVRLDHDVRDAPDLTRAYGHQALWLSLASRNFAPAHEKIRRGLDAIDPTFEPAVIYRHFYWFAITAARVGGRADVADDLVQRSAAVGAANHPDGVLAVEKLRQLGDDAKAREVLRARLGRRCANGLEAYAAEWALSERRYRDALDATLAAEAAPFWYHPDWIGFHAFYYPRVLLLRAKARLALGEQEAARADLDRLLGIWAQADAGMPALEEARRLRQTLVRSLSSIRAP